MYHYYDYFESIYKEAGADYSRVPWARLEPHAELVEWERRRGPMPRMRAAVVGCGPGDDAAVSLLRPGGRLPVMALANLSNKPNPPRPPHPVRKRAGSFPDPRLRGAVAGFSRVSEDRSI